MPEMPIDVKFNVKEQEKAKVKGIFTKIGDLFSGKFGSAIGGLVGGAAGGAAGAIAGGAILGVLNKAVEYLKMGSTRLQGVFTLFEKAFMIFFKPFGDFLAALLRPLAIFLIAFAVQFMKTIKPLLDKLLELFGKKEEKTEETLGEKIADLLPGSTSEEHESTTVGGNEGEVTDAEARKTAIEEFIDGTFTAIQGILSSLGGLLPNIEDIGRLWSDIILPAIVVMASIIAAAIAFIIIAVLGAFAVIYSTVVAFGGSIVITITALIAMLGEVLTFILTLVSGVVQILSGDISGGIQTIIDGFLTMVVNIANLWMAASLIIQGFMGEAVKVIGAAIIGLLIAVISAVQLVTGMIEGKFSKPFNDMLETWKTALSAAKDSLNNFIAEALNTAKNSLTNISNGITNLLKGGHQVGSDYIGETGFYLLHRGEQVVAATAPGGGRGGDTYNITIPVSATINKELDIDTLADELARRTRDSLRRRTSYGVM